MAYDDEFGYTDLPVENHCPNGMCNTWQKKTQINFEKEIRYTIDDTPQGYDEPMEQWIMISLDWLYFNNFQTNF